MWRTFAHRRDSLSAVPVDRLSDPQELEGAATEEAIAVEPVWACPELIGMSVQDARRVARLSGLLLKVEERPAGQGLWSRVLGQIPDPDTNLVRGDVVSITIGARPQVVVPDVRGGTELDALTTLRDAGLVPSRRVARQSDRVPEGYVVRTRPRPGASVTAGTRIAYVIATAPRRHSAKRHRDPGPARAQRLPDGTFLSMPGRD